MANKKFLKVLSLAAFSVLGLTACGNEEIYAKPSDYDTGKIVTIADDKINLDTFASLKDIYDSIHEGSLASDVLDKLLFKYSISAFGEYAYDWTVAGSINEAYADATADGSSRAKVNAFIKSHSAYWDKKADGTRDTTNENVASESEINRLIAKFEYIEKQIKETLYTNISTGTYGDEPHMFSEFEYLVSLRHDGEKVENYNNLSMNSQTYENKQFFPGIDKEEIFDHFLHRQYYQSITNTYVVDKLIPSIYRDLLVQQYVVDQHYNTLGRSYGRKVNVIAIKNNDKYDVTASLLIKNLLSRINTFNTQIDEDTFNTYSNVWNGLTSKGEWINVYEEGQKTAEQQIIEEVRATNKYAFEIGELSNGIKYYKGTTFGDVLDDFVKITDNPLTTDTGLESDFTNNNSYSKEYGLELKQRSTVLNNYVTKGWFIKGGLGSLPSSITDRLFSSQVSEYVDYDDNPKHTGSQSHDRFASDGSYDADKDDNKYVAKINGKYYLKNSGTQPGDPTKPDERLNDIMFYDSSSKTYYVVQIEEAANSSKLNKNADANNYSKFRNREKKETLEEIQNEITKLVFTGDTYNSLSKQYYLEKMNISYHDQVVYNYFHDNFPDLFK